MKTWTTKNKNDWPDGEWKDEPDKAQWINKEANLDCLIVRGPLGSLCGYVGIPKSHPYFEKDYNDVDASAHGGLTFADLCDPSESFESNICHTGDIVNKLVWWLGFDCAHSGDYLPGNKSMHNFMEQDFYSYKNFDYVQSQVNELAIQLSEKDV